jgi:hypothetical protein
MEWRLEMMTSLKAVSAFYTQEEVKRLINVFLNTSADKVIRSILAKTLFPPQQVLQLLRQLEELRPNLLSTAQRLGFDGRFTDPHNINYFALEYLEQIYIRQFLEVLGIRQNLNSVVLVHDGLYFSPPAPAEEIALISSIAARKTGLPPLQLHMQNLTNLWNPKFGHLGRMIAELTQATKRQRTHPSQESQELCSIVRTKHEVHFDRNSNKLVKRKAHIAPYPAPAPKRRLTYETSVSRNKTTKTDYEASSSRATLHAYFSKKRLFGLE